MKKLAISIFVIGLFAVTPAITNAHTGGDVVDGGSAISVTEFEEIQDVMIKMMNGETLTNEEAGEMYEFMGNHHGALDRFGGNQMMGYNNWTPGFGTYMHNGIGGGSFAYWLMMLAVLTWLFVGILFSVVLIKKISKPQNHE